MSNNTQKGTWWDLHLKVARGEKLTDQEKQLYDAEMSQHDQIGSHLSNIDLLKKLRAEIATLSQQNEQMRAHITSLEAEIKTIEKRLSKETRELLEVQE